MSDQKEPTAISTFLMDDHVTDDNAIITAYDDDFEEFPVEDWPTTALASSLSSETTASTTTNTHDVVDYSMWEKGNGGWDYELGENVHTFGTPEQQLFCEQLRLEIAKVSKNAT